MTGKTKSGFEYDIPEEAADDYELLEELMKIDDGDFTGVTKAVHRLLGEEQTKKLKEHLRGDNGRVSAVAMMNEISYMLLESPVLKN